MITPKLDTDKKKNHICNFVRKPDNLFNVFFEKKKSKMSVQKLGLASFGKFLFNNIILYIG